MRQWRHVDHAYIAILLVLRKPANVSWMRAAIASFIKKHPGLGVFPHTAAGWI